VVLAIHARTGSVKAVRRKWQVSGDDPAPLKRFLPGDKRSIALPQG